MRGTICCVLSKLALVALLACGRTSDVRPEPHPTKGDTDRAREANDDKQSRSKAALEAPELRKELLELVEADQAARHVLVEAMKRGEKPDFSTLIPVDAKSSQALRRAIAAYGWPGKRIVGEDGAHAAWLLAQHADRDLALQKDALARMEALLAAGEVRRDDFAYLVDRVAVAEHRKQRYGTQFTGDVPAPIEDEANVDQRRKEMGLGTMAEYREQIRAAYGPQPLGK